MVLLGLDGSSRVRWSLGRGVPGQRELELVPWIREPQLELPPGGLHGAAFPRARRFGLRPSTSELVLDDRTNGSECQTLNLGLEPRDLIEQHRLAPGAPHGRDSIVEGPGQSKSPPLARDPAATLGQRSGIAWLAWIFERSSHG